jgi:enoyl-CoA hydratase
MIDAQEAYRVGLANKVVPLAGLLQYCKDIAAKMLTKGMYANSLAKACINSGMDTDLLNGLKIEADLFGLSFASPDQKEGMSAFLEKRKANLSDF